VTGLEAGDIVGFYKDDGVVSEYIIEVISVEGWDVIYRYTAPPRLDLDDMRAWSVKFDQRVSYFILSSLHKELM
jgi:hypothetical protein